MTTRRPLFPWRLEWGARGGDGVPRYEIWTDSPNAFGLLFGVNLVTWDRWNTSTVLVHVGFLHFAINLGRVRPGA